MFRLHKAAVIRQYVSEDVKIKLHIYSCSHTYDYEIYGGDVTFTYTLGTGEISAIGFIIICMSKAV
jgi:hypothetical protein